MNYLLLIFGLIITIINISKAQNSTSCFTPNDQPGVCIELDRCADFYNRVLSKRLSEQNSLLSLSICDYSNGNVMYCCAVRSIIGKRILPKRTGVTIMVGDIKTWACGSGVIEPSYGFRETYLNEFPWMALLEYTTKSNRREHKCEGSLINNRYVITSAHCIETASTGWSLINVRLGEWNKSASIDCIINSEGHPECADFHIDVPVERVIVHENYKFNPAEKIVHNNIGLLRLARQIQFTDWIGPICLPTTNSLRTATFDSFAFHVAGWGPSELVMFRDTKFKAMVIVNSLSTCRSIYSDFGIVLRDDQMCAGGVKGIDVDYTVSGTPLIGLDTTNKLRNSYFLAGIYSFIKKLEGIPGVYTRVGLYVDWILENMQP